MSGYQETANRARAAGAKSSPPKPNGKAFVRGAETAAVTKGLAAAAGRRADKAAAAASKTPRNPKGTFRARTPQEASKLKNLKTGAKWGARLGKGAGPALAATAAYELADYGRRKREEGEKRGFTRYDSSLGSSGYVQTSQKNKEGKKWSEQRAEDRKAKKESKKTESKSTAGAYAMGTSGARTTAVQRAAERRTTPGYRPLYGAEAEWKKKKDFEDATARYKRDRSAYNRKAKSSNLQDSVDVENYRKNRIANKEYKGKYYGPDAFKGDMNKLKAWRKAGSPKDVKAFAKSHPNTGR